MAISKEAAFAVSLFREPQATILRSCAQRLPTAIYEIRVYTDRAVAFITPEGPRFCLNSGGTANYPAGDLMRLNAAQALDVLSTAADRALFFKEDSLKNGFLTKNGCRIGICGLTPDGKVPQDGVTSLNIRVPDHTAHPLTDPRVNAVLREGGGLLVAGAPGAGKTTLLKACLRTLVASGSGWRRVTVVDERDEFMPVIKGEGPVCAADIISGLSKAEGIRRALRLMGPEIILCDEIGSARETREILEGLNSGVRFICSIHAGSREELFRRGQFLALWNAGVFSHALILSKKNKGEITEVVCREEARICG